MRHSFFAHNGPHIRKVQVHHARHSNQIADALNALTKHIVRHAEGFRKAYVADRVKQAVIGDDDKRIHGILQVHDAVDRVVHANFALKSERLCHYADGENPHLLCAFRNDRRCARSRSAAHAGSDEHKIRSLERFRDCIPAFLGRFAANLRIRTRAEPLGQLFADLDLLSGARKVERLLIRIDGNKLHTAQAVLNHAVDRVVPRAADSDDFQLRKLAAFKIQFQTDGHMVFLLSLLHKEILEFFH